MTLVLLGLDALDAGLVEHFGCDTLHLETHDRMETFSYMRDVPYTPEVWPTIATGLHPRDHGVTRGQTSSWDNPLVDSLSRFVWMLPPARRSQLGDIAERVTGAEYTIGRTDEPTFFDGPSRAVHNWPGVANSEELVKVWDIPKPGEAQSVRVFERELRGLGIQKLAWGREMLPHDLALAGVHDHTLDMGGHIYSDDEARLGALYDWVDERVAEIVANLDADDDLLVVSDHGMVTSFYSDEGDGEFAPGDHSWRAYAATTAESVPASVFDVFDWVEDHVEDANVEEDQATIDVPEEQLRDLGYM